MTIIKLLFRIMQTYSSINIKCFSKVGLPMLVSKLW